MKTNAKIYVMRAEDGTLKLGHSVDPARRANQLGRPVEIVHETDVLHEAERIERLAHRVLALHGEHLRGEWFKAELDEAIRAIEIAVKQAEGYQLALGGRLNTAGRGRPPLGDEALVQTAFRFTHEQLDWLDAESEREGRVGRNAILRRLVDKAIRESK